MEKTSLEVTAVTKYDWHCLKCAWDACKSLKRMRVRLHSLHKPKSQLSQHLCLP